jgi:hypothetical protein
VLKYLARYTHRVAISNGRLLRYRSGHVTFRYKDYTVRGRVRTLTLTGGEFIRRFLLHVLPKGFMRIRYFGYLANRHRQQKLAVCRRLAGDAASPPVAPAGHQSTPPLAARDAPVESLTCPACQRGVLQIIYTWDRYSPAAYYPPRPAAAGLPREDSS